MSEERGEKIISDSWGSTKEQREQSSKQNSIPSTGPLAEGTCNGQFKEIIE